jgi:hypothetical protein
VKEILMITRLLIACIIVPTISGMEPTTQWLKAMSDEIRSITVKLPSAEQIRMDLYNAGYAPFYNRTYIDLNLGGQEFDLITLSNIVGRHIYNYMQLTIEEAKQQMQHVGMHIYEPIKISKDEVLRRILYQMPDAYEKLRAYEAKINNHSYYRSGSILPKSKKIVNPTSKL